MPPGASLAAFLLALFALVMRTLPSAPVAATVEWTHQVAMMQGMVAEEIFGAPTSLHLHNDAVPGCAPGSPRLPPGPRPVPAPGAPSTSDAEAAY